MVAKVASNLARAGENNGQRFPWLFQVKKMESSEKKCENWEKDKKRPKNSTVPGCRGLGSSSFRMNHNPRVLEVAFTNRFAGVETARRQKSYNFGRFGPCRAHH